MSTLKEEFKNWLVKQGLSEKTKTGRPGTVYEYVRRINKIANTIYTGCDIQPWEQLANDIHLIFGYYLLCQKGSVRIDHSNIKQIEDFISDFISKMSTRNDNLQNIFIFELHSDKSPDDVIHNYTQIKDLLPWFQRENPSYLTLIIDIRLSQREQDKNRAALSKFYEFLKGLETSKGCQDSSSNKIQKNSEILLDNVKSFNVQTSNTIKLILDQGSNKYAPNLKPNPKYSFVEKEANSETVMLLLQISRQTLKRLATSKESFYRLEAIPTKPNYYDLDAVNAYALKHFFSSNKDETFGTYGTKKLWLTPEETEKKLNWSSTTLKRNRRKITYFNPAPSIFLYYAPEVIRLKKVQRKKQGLN